MPRQNHPYWSFCGPEKSRLGRCTLRVDFVTSRYNFVTFPHFTIRYILLRFITIRHDSLHLITFDYISSHYELLLFVTIRYDSWRFCYISLQFVTFSLDFVNIRDVFVTFRYNSWCYVTFRYNLSRFVTFCYITTRYFLSRFMTFCYISLHFVTFRYILLRLVRNPYKTNLRRTCNENFMI